MFYFFISSNFKPVIISDTWQEVARRIRLNLIEYLCMVHVGPTLKIKIIDLNKQRCLLRGYRFLSNKEVMEKLGGSQIVFFFFFSVKNIGLSTWNKQEII